MAKIYETKEDLDKEVANENLRADFYVRWAGPAILVIGAAVAGLNRWRKGHWLTGISDGLIVAIGAVTTVIFQWEKHKDEKMVNRLGPEKIIIPQGYKYKHDESGAGQNELTPTNDDTSKTIALVVENNRITKEIRTAEPPPSEPNPASLPEGKHVARVSAAEVHEEASALPQR